MVCFNSPFITIPEIFCKLAKTPGLSAYLSPPPLYKPICGPLAAEKGVEDNLMSQFVCMSSDGYYGRVLDRAGIEQLALVTMSHGLNWCFCCRGLFLLSRLCLWLSLHPKMSPPSSTSSLVNGHTNHSNGSTSLGEISTQSSSSSSHYPTNGFPQWVSGRQCSMICFLYCMACTGSFRSWETIVLITLCLLAQPSRVHITKKS